MKNKKLLLSPLVLLCALQVSAQSAIGLRGGLQFATITHPQTGLGTNLELDHNMGWSAALYAELGLSKRFAIQPEITWLQKGSKISGRDAGIDFSLEANVNYLEVPVLAKWKMGADKAKLFVQLGPSAGYALGGEGTLTIAGVSTTDKIEFDKEYGDDQQKDQRWDFGVIAGAGGMLAAGPGSILLDLRYGWDFTDFVSFQNTKPADHESSQNRGLGISLGYQLPLGSASE